MEQVSVIVPAHNAEQTLADQLRALAEELASHSTPGAGANPGAGTEAGGAASASLAGRVEVLVVDNNSTDRTAEVARGFAGQLPGLRVVSAGAGSGVAYARNAGAAVANGAQLLFCDSDDVIRPGWVAALSRGLDKHDLVGGVLAVPKINSVAVRGWVPAPPTDALPMCMKFLPYATGANLGVRRELWARLDGFAESYVGGHEEVDFAWRAQLAGYSLGFVPEAVVDYRLRADLPGAMRQRFGYGRSYAQLYAQFEEHPIRRLSAKHEVKVIGGFLLSGPREVVHGRGGQWLVGLAWTLGRWRGNLAYGVRCPL